jgi:hypothetical protein
MTSYQIETPTAARNQSPRREDGREPIQSCVARSAPAPQPSSPGAVRGEFAAEFIPKESAQAI